MKQNFLSQNKVTYIDYKDIDSDDYEIYAEMLGQLSDDEISKMKMMYELKR